jgi:diaminopimelate decarboxylase
MNDLVRPAFYGAHHAIEPVGPQAPRTEVVDVVGPVCESGDFLARRRRLPETAAGDLLCVRTAGAYGFAMSSQYNARPRAAEVLVDRSRGMLARRREAYRDLVAGETPRPRPRRFGRGARMR